MKEELITFETAKLAKEKGFDLYGRPYYTKSGRLVLDAITGPYAPAPTQALLQKWLRDKHKIYVSSNFESLENGLLKSLELIETPSPNDH